MTAMTPSQTAHLIDDYPTTDNITLAHRYGITLNDVERIGRTNQLRKDPDETRGRMSAIAIDNCAHWNTPATPPAPRPQYPHTDYCPACGLSFHHWPGCPHTGDGLPVLRGA